MWQAEQREGTVYAEWCRLVLDNIWSTERVLYLAIEHSVVLILISDKFQESWLKLIMNIGKWLVQQ